MTTHIVFGAMACGKTTHAEKIAKHLGANGVVDDFYTGHQLTEGAVHLTHDPRFYRHEGGNQQTLLSRTKVTVHQFDDLIAQIGGAA